MTIDINDMIEGLSPERRKKVETRATELIAEELTRQEREKRAHPTNERDDQNHPGPPLQGST